MAGYNSFGVVLSSFSSSLVLVLQPSRRVVPAPDKARAGAGARWRWRYRSRWPWHVLVLGRHVVPGASRHPDHSVTNTQIGPPLSCEPRRAAARRRGGVMCGESG